MTVGIARLTSQLHAGIATPMITHDSVPRVIVTTEQIAIFLSIIRRAAQVGQNGVIGANVSIEGTVFCL